MRGRARTCSGEASEPPAWPLRNPAFARLFAAQLLSLLGTGLMTAAVARLALRFGGADGADGTWSVIFVLKMVA